MMRIAIVGSGISGLVCAHLLHPEHEIQLFEASGRIGGHTNTVPVHRGGRTWQVDTGFIVHNEHNYPNFTRILRACGVETQASTMSFSVRDENTGFEWGGHDFHSLFAQKRNLVSPGYWKFLRDIIRFNKILRELVHQPEEGLTIGTVLDRHGFNQRLRNHYLVPMASAIWSMPSSAIDGFPAVTMARFMDHHRMLQVEGRPEWRTITGGSWRYVQAMTAPFHDRIRTNCPVQRIHRSERGVRIEHAAGSDTFDEVILACHSDQSLRMLGDASAAEQDILGSIRYTGNRAILHTDRRMLPRNKAAWSAWNAHVASGLTDRAALTYDMNILQRLGSSERFLVTLGRDQAIDSDQHIKTIDYEHPFFDAPAVAAQQRWAEISGVNRIHFCGAYWGWGFHEDGVRSALNVCERWGVGL